MNETEPSLTMTPRFKSSLKSVVESSDGSVSFIGLGKRYMRIDVSLKKHMDRLLKSLAEIRGTP